jgi:BirA family transcriptional regulator, biotin operon repressor / biotin---[acetyl-CoA-carboxylase] ligase
VSTKQEILQILFQHPEEFISGQAICEKLGCSRTAVWKQVKELEKEGYRIESVQKRGYRLTGTPNKLSAAEIKAHLETESLGQNVVYEESISSTQKLAHHLAEDGAASGTLVVADEQVSGRGRLGRPWHSPKGTGIWMSLILRPELPLNKIPQLTLTTAVAIVKAIKKVAKVDCQIKWPNDILYNGKKLVGILTELQAEENRAKAVIIGIGMNVNLTSDDIPDEIKNIATSIQMLTGEPCSRAHLIQSIMKEMEILYRLYLSEGFSVIKVMWEAYALNIGQTVIARKVNGESIKGLAKGITDDGVLLVEDQTGELHHIYSADIEL